VKFQVLVLDYDGTVATDGVLHPAVRAAIGRLRAAGGMVVLATGRILDELEHVAGDLHFVDAVVAENGAVAAFPADNRTLLLGHEPPTALLRTLTERGVDFVAGHSVVETDADNAQEVLSAIRDLELPLALTFNRSRLMVLPQGITKASGLHEVLRLLRRSEHNAVAIGDAENDHILLDVCECGVAVAWGSPALKSVADLVLAGDGPQAVAEFIDALTAQPHLPAPREARRRIVLGADEAQRAITLPVQDRAVLIVGDTKSGKSHVAGLLAEQLITQRYAVCVIDPEGDYRALESLPGVVLLGSDGPPHLEAIDQLVRHPELSLVIGLSSLDLGEKRASVAAIMPHLAAMRRQRGVPHRIVLDEAHYFLQPGERCPLSDGDLAAWTLVTYRLAALHPDVCAAAPLIISTRLTDQSEVRALLALGGGTAHRPRWAEVLANLPIGEAVLLQGAAEESAQPVRCRLAPRLTAHVRHRQKYVDVPVMEGRAFDFTRDGVATGIRARSLGELAALIRELPPELVAGHLRRGDISRWIQDVFGDHVLAARVRAIESRTAAEHATGAAHRLARLIEARYLPPDEVPRVARRPRAAGAQPAER
jgi:hydroxymethylpyrimidine pyrophosphatase-like HAD family hydrolase